jgi:hypothetical protein
MGPKKRHQEFDDDEGSEASGSPTTQPGTSKKARRAVKGPKANSDSKLDLILQKLASIETQNSVIVNKVKDIELRVVSTENNLKSVREDCDVLTGSVLKLQADMRDLRQVPPSSVSLLKNSVSSLLNNQNTRRSESDYLYAEVNKLNLLISGISESPRESSSSLASEVQRLILDITGKQITIDVAHRIGRNQPNQTRIIKVRFLSVLERNCVYFHRKNLCPPYFINEDLSPETRRDHALLRRKKKDILSIDKDAIIKIDWRSKTLKHGSSLFAVKDGILGHSSPHQPTGSSTSNQEMNTSFLEESEPSTSQQRNIAGSPKL